MEQFFEILKNVKLFEGIDRGDLFSMLSCLQARVVPFKKGDFVLSAGQKAEHVGIVLSGRLHILREDYEGGRSLLDSLAPGDIFAETLCCAGIEQSPVGVMAETEAEVMLLGFRRILKTCPSSCSFHARLIENMLQVVAQKNILLQNRMEFLSRKTIREKVLSYLESFAMRQGKDFSIPLNREQLADFLCVDRSALSRELGRLKAEGVIDFWKNRFRLNI
jgi:CRP-like cAMP-binding protein